MPDVECSPTCHVKTEGTKGLGLHVSEYLPRRHHPSSLRHSRSEALRRHRRVIRDFLADVNACRQKTSPWPTRNRGRRLDKPLCIVKNQEILVFPIQSTSAAVGVEPTTYGFEVRHSIQLSYERLVSSITIFVVQARLRLSAGVSARTHSSHVGLVRNCIKMIRPGRRGPSMAA